MENENFFTESLYYKIKISHAQLEKLIEIAYNLKQAFHEKQMIGEKALNEAKQFLAMLLEYLIKNRDTTKVDPTLIGFIEEVLGIKKKKKKKKFQEEEKDRLEERFFKHRYRMAMYEIYKIVNPSQLAGETGFENFMNNLMTKGLVVARKHQGGNFAKLFTPKEIDNIVSYKYVIKHILKESKKMERCEITR